MAERGRMPAGVRALVAEVMRREEYEGPHEVAEEFEEAAGAEVYGRLGGLVGMPADGLVLVADADAAFAVLVGRLGLGRGDRVWTTPFESVGRLSVLTAACARSRARLETVPLRADGDLDLEWMAARLDEDVALVSVTHVPMGCGIVQPVEAVGRLLAGHRCLYAVDGAQSVGQLPVDGRAMGCDVLTGDGWRFLRGPLGVGFAALSPRARALLATPAPASAMGGWAASTGVSGGVGSAGVLGPEPQLAAVVGLNAALTDQAGIGAVDGAGLWPLLRAAVGQVPGVELIAPGRVQCGIVTFHHPRLPAALIRRELAARGVAVWKTVAQQMPLYLPQRGVTTAVRASVDADHTPHDLARLTQALEDVIRTATPRTAAPARTSALAAAAPAMAGPAGAANDLPTATRPAAGRRHLTLLPSLTPA
ncbi:aminotransferase class V-fold PLP-dependent enzyme [Streptomyces sp. NPDC005485]|uniref:aminotransferase class V-fold PLP-dependent enzyme n=1 Tax=Streptomyces sp. NPDC005485 TaxID=3155591 RepID=UPI0033A5C726